MKSLIAFTFALFSTMLSYGQFVVLPDNYRLDTTDIYHEPNIAQIGDSLHVVAYNTFLKVEINVTFIEYSGDKNFIAQDKAGYLWLVRRGRKDGWYYYELVDLENLDYKIRYYYTQKF